jgi:hypothetical protein
MDKEEENIDQLFKNEFSQDRIENTATDWKRFNSNIKRINFLKFNFSSFNIYYMVSIITIALVSGVLLLDKEPKVKDESAIHIEDQNKQKTNSSTTFVNEVKETKETNKNIESNSLKYEKQKPTNSYKINKSNKEELEENEPKSQIIDSSQISPSANSDTSSIETADTVRVVVNKTKTVVKKVKVVVRDTVKQ